MTRTSLLTLLLPLLLAAGTPPGVVIENTATYEDAAGSVPSNTVRVTVQEVCAATLTPTLTERTARPGDPVTAAHTLTNTGNARRTFPLQARLDGEGTVNVTVDGNGNGQPDEAPAREVTLDPDGSAQVLLTVVPLSSGLVTGTLLSGCDGTLGAALRVRSQVGAPLITKAVEGDLTAEAGDTVRYRLEVTNPERIAMSGVQIEDVLSAGLTYVAVEGGAEGVLTEALDGGRTRVTWRTDLAAGETRVYTVVTTVAASVPDDTEIENTAVATGEGGSTRSTPPAIIRVFTSRLLITKAASSGTVDAGGLIGYTVTVTNPADTTLSSTVVTDVPDRRLTVLLDSVKVNGQATPATLAGGRLTVPVGILAPKAGATITYNAHAPLTSDGTPLNNAVSAAALGKQGRVVAVVNSNVATAQVTLRSRLSTSGNDIVGRVYVDRDGNARFDAGRDTPVARARVLLAGGREALTDASGLYSFRDVPAGLHALRLDPRSVPYRLPTPAQAGQGLSGPGTAPVQVLALTVQDFPLLPNTLTLAWQWTVQTEHADVTVEPGPYQTLVRVRNRRPAPTCLTLGPLLPLVQLPSEAGHEMILPGTPDLRPQETPCP
ncbi:isopeptide-forming domain-containing fimbrial protein [Deinococcus sp. MIMF12]|uniref:Isopeptide-forming domain-containing fimbrial protein n=1 Tax=Deinococcus rhizophilus TaxID=3049544 RepID=A0ABT7JD78_9DEIO|nr:isopeptide-forming domain-containing fimbrial protein [Deinococcus rhizophilus]MDL2342982.1 isopeptide-forming domain-containing fimbrial protein [Deinococcus rhizophilus]